MRGEVDRLTETRLSLLEDRAGALLDRGRPDMVVRELAPVAREHPFREGLWSLLALGQYRTLRQADALATLRELRQRLGGELGIDPSAQVRELETGILRQAPELAGPSAAVSISDPAAVTAAVVTWSPPRFLTWSPLASRRWPRQVPPARRPRRSAGTRPWPS